ncbi:hypothetical protein D8674_013110 [Pyrus ussuriensis x Pyrus communis]|uniref:Uncharacterized protein n=1 Tax=Pyrus ussuriensis x Pyrus communis TaxID=2448454 RepID=A0A5N5GTK9_9ROSA|nr:hypothetical protein D8674_013110 [Pyrus ussuriensis x Pyrus communis]
MVQAKPSEHLMTFHVMDNLPLYNVILGREWLHAMGKVPFKDPSRYSKLMRTSKRFNDREIEGLVPTDETLVEERKSKPLQASLSDLKQSKSHTKYMQFDSLPKIYRQSSPNPIAT